MIAYNSNGNKSHNCNFTWAVAPTTYGFVSNCTDTNVPVTSSGSEAFLFAEV